MANQAHILYPTQGPPAGRVAVLEFLLRLAGFVPKLSTLVPANTAGPLILLCDEIDFAKQSGWIQDNLRRFDDSTHPERFLIVFWGERQNEVPSDFAKIAGVKLSVPMGSQRFLLRLNRPLLLDPKRNYDFPPPPAYTLNDAAATEDLLNFNRYVAMLTKLLTNEATRGPLTLSVEADWGGGKSSLMNLLRNDLQNQRQFQVFSFNPWKHEKGSAMVAAFAHAFEDRLVPRWSVLWFKLRWRRIALRFQLSTGWLWVSLLALGLVILVVTTLLISLAVVWLTSRQILANREVINESIETLRSSARWGGPWIFWWGVGSGQSWRSSLGLSGSALFLTLLASFVPLINAARPPAIAAARWLSKQMSAPWLESEYGFLEYFHADFAMVCRLVSEKQKTFVFVDDLDRCSVPVAAELLSSLSHLLHPDPAGQLGRTTRACEPPNLIFVMGIDRQKVAAGIAAHHADVLDFLPLNTAKKNGEGSERAALRAHGIEFGTTFLEKFVQFKFVLPVPDQGDIRAWIQHLLEPMYKAAKDSAQALENVLVQVLPVLGRNPRRIKQFLNLFLLLWYIHDEQAKAKGRAGRLRVSLVHLAKVAAVTLRWPSFFELLRAKPESLTLLEECAVDPAAEREHLDDPVLGHWVAKAELLEVLRSGLESDPNNVSFLCADVDPMLKMLGSATSMSLRPSRT